MTTVTAPTLGAPLTRADRDALPEDGRRHELLDGVLVVTPCPSGFHQRASARLHALLLRAAPPDLEVLAAPLDVALGPDTVVQPDLVVSRRVDLRPAGLEVAPLLVVEILSPRTTSYDLGWKKSLYESAGVPSYWTLDPATRALSVWRLVGRSYQPHARVRGQQSWTATDPFEVTIVPAVVLA